MTRIVHGLTLPMQAAALAITLVGSSAAMAGEVRYEFTASGMLSSKPMFELQAPAGPVIGSFAYDPNTPANYAIPRPDVDCQGYRQQRPGGFRAKFGDIEVVADDYVVELFNDLPQPGGLIADVVTIISSSDLTPPVSPPLQVDGISRDEGQFQISFMQFGGTQFDSPDLSKLEGLEFFHSAFAMLGDTGHASGSADVLASLEAVAAAPPPSADFDGDYDVDGADFLIWQRTLGNSGSSGGDANDDSFVDSADLAAWRGQFNFPATAATAIPEPGVAIIALPILLLCAASRSGGRR